MPFFVFTSLVQPSFYSFPYLTGLSRNNENGHQCLSLRQTHSNSLRQRVPRSILIAEMPGCKQIMKPEMVATDGGHDTFFRRSFFYLLIVLHI